MKVGLKYDTGLSRGTNERCEMREMIVVAERMGLGKTCGNSLRGRRCCSGRVKEARIMQKSATDGEPEPLQDLEPR